MSKAKVSKMKEVCTQSPGKFASALLDILDGSIEDGSMEVPPLPMVPPLPKASPFKKGALLKRPAAAAELEDEEAPSKKKKKCLAKDARNSSKVEAPIKAALTKQTKIAEQNLEAKRRKELKSIKLTTLKIMVQRKGLDVGTKEKMIESIIALEAKSRENIRKHKGNVRSVIEKKREEFASKTNNQLKELLQAYALSTSGTKPERVQRLLATWKEQGEIEKVLAGMAFQARKVELNAMDKVQLFELCRKKGVDALSKEVLVERLLVHESVEIWQEVMEARRSSHAAGA